MVVGVIVVVVYGYGYAGQTASVPSSTLDTELLDHSEMKAAAIRDFGEATELTMSAEAALKKYGKRLAEGSTTAVEASEVTTLAEAPTASIAGTNTYNLPIKSANLNLAPQPKFWTVVKGSPDADMEPGKPHAVYGNDLGDPNAVHGALTADGGFVHAGVGTSEGAGDAFAAKFSASGTFVWGWKSGRSGPDVANAVCELPAAYGGGVIVAGAAFTLDGSNQVLRTLWKLDGATGAIVWTAQFTTGGGNSAFEMVDVTASGLIFSGVGKKEAPEGMAFKSYGNVDSAEAVGNVMIIPFEALRSNIAPTNSAIAQEFFFAEGSGTCKAARALPNGDIATVCLSPMPWSKPIRTAGVKYPSFRMAVFDSTLTPKWNKDIMLMITHEPTDLTISTDGTEVVVSGHGQMPSSPTSASDTGQPNTYSGWMTSVKSADGTVAWQEPHNAGGIPLLQYNECWGISTVADGYVLTCGTGVECDPGVCCRIPSLQTGALFTGVTPESMDRPQATYVLEDKCDRGASDDRTGSVHRPPGKWSSMVIKTNTMGKMVWQRVDAYQDDSGNWDASAAAEFSVMTPTGIGVQTDLSVGFGLLFLEY